MCDLACRGGIISNLSLIVVAPGVDLPVLRADQTVQGATGNVHHPLCGQHTKNPLGSTLVRVIAVTKSKIVTFAPEIKNKTNVEAGTNEYTQKPDLTLVCLIYYY